MTTNYLMKGVEPTFKMSRLPNTPQTTDIKYNIGIICLCVVLKIVIIKVISSTMDSSVLNFSSGAQKSARKRNPATVDSWLSVQGLNVVCSQPQSLIVPSHDDLRAVHYICFSNALQFAVHCPFAHPVGTCHCLVTSSIPVSTKWY
jgi:hypothetical protein